MKRRTLIIELVLAAVLAVSTVLILRNNDQVKHAPDIRVGVENYAPFITANADGELTGISATILKKIAADNNLSIGGTKPMQLAELLSFLAEDKIDVVTSVAANEERVKTALYTKPYMTVGSTLITTQDAPPKTICVGKGFAIETWVRANMPELVVITAATDAACVDEMFKGNIDAVAMDNIVLSAMQISRQWKQVPLGFSYSYSFAISKKRPDLLEIFNAAIK